MKKILTLLTVLTFLFAGKAKASHIAGGDLSYVCLGGDQYQINLNLFVDCLGFDPGTTQTVSFTSSCGGTAFANVSVTNPGGTEISQLCPSMINNSTCNGGTLPGMWVFHFTGVVTLSPPCDTWTMSWNVCCRNAAVLNVVSPDSFGSYIEATLNSATAACNNSPSFTAQPIPYVCSGQLVNYNYGVVETDGDSLHYSLISAMDAGATPITYSAGYSATSPIPGIVIDPVTGTLTFVPTTLGNFVVVVLVEEYDSNGNLVGTVMRDIQFIVQSCSNVVPDPAAGAITSMSGTATQTGPFSIELCEGSNFSFNATFNDANATDVLSLLSNLATVLPGSVITTSGTNPIVATISWTAPAGSANTNTTFSVTVDDGACPIPGQQTFVYDIEVQPRTLAGPDHVICGPQSFTLSGTGGNVFNWAVISGPPMVVGTNFSCNPCANPVATPTATTTYEVTSDLSGTCVNKDTVTVTVVPDYSFTTTQSTGTLCLDQTVQFNVAGSPAGTYTYAWTPGSTLDNTAIGNPTATLNAAGSYTYYVTITSPLGCIKKDTVTATVLPAIRTLANNDTVLCGAQSANLSANGGNVFNWTVLTGPPMVVGTNFSCATCPNPVATPTSTTTYLVTSDLSGTCVNRDTITVTVVPDYSFNITQSTSTTCLGNPIQLNTNVTPAGTYAYSWSPGTYLSGTTIPNPTATITIPGTYNYVLTLINSQGCVKQNVASITITPSYAPAPILNVSSSPVCVGDTVQLSTSYGVGVPATCGVNPVTCTAALAALVGSPTGVNTTTTWPAIFGNWYTSEKHQMLFRASELLAAGITGGKIDQLDVPVNAINGTTQYHFFTVKMGCTSLGALGTTWESGLYQVFDPKTVNVSVGLNAIVFDRAFEWDGISNIIIEICSTEGPGPGSYTNYTLSSISPYTTTAFNSCLYSFSDANDMCPDLVNFVNTSLDRPLLQFHYCAGAPDTSNFVYSWLPGGSVLNATSQFTGAIVPGNTTYSVIVTDNISGCLDTASVSVTTLPTSVLSVDAGADVVICPGTTTNLTATGAAQYTWTPVAGLSNTNIANPIASPAVTTTYIVTGTGACALPQSDSVHVTVRTAAPYNSTAGADQAVCLGEPVTLNATASGGYGNNMYNWFLLSGTTTDSIQNSNSPNASVMTTQGGMNTYMISVVDLCGQVTTDTVAVDVMTDCDLDIPNVFTPNGDGSNDEFKITANGVKTYSIAIYDRWGKKVFESTDIKDSWKGGNAADGTFYYILKAETTNGKTYDKTGYIQLLH